MSVGFRLSRQAEADLDEIWLYIAEDNVHAANRLRDRLLAELRRLDEWPFIGHAREGISPSGLRFWPVGRYVIVYCPETDALVILRILGGKQQLDRLLGEAS